MSDTKRLRFMEFCGEPLAIAWPVMNRQGEWTKNFDILLTDGVGNTHSEGDWVCCIRVSNLSFEGAMGRVERARANYQAKRGWKCLERRFFNGWPEPLLTVPEPEECRAAWEEEPVAMVART